MPQGWQSGNSKNSIAYAVAYISIHSISFYLAWFCHLGLYFFLNVWLFIYVPLDISQEINKVFSRDVSIFFSR